MLEKADLYRFPWSMNDNPIAWLEVTDICNIYCEGCYRQRITGHKSLAEIKDEILFFKKWRNPDNVSIAGGEPLIHPDIEEVVAFIAENGIKPVILTNAAALDKQKLHGLVEAGLAGFTIHIDSHQNRPNWKGKTEGELNELREYYADMIAQENAGIYTVFNSTVYPSSYDQIPDVVRWGQKHLGKVHGLVFITYRTAASDTKEAYDYGGEKVDLSQLSYSTERFDEKFVTGPEVIQKIQETYPDYQPAGYLGGTVKHDSFKWLAGAIVGNDDQVYGVVGKRTMELSQVFHHLFYGTYLAYLSQARIGSKIFLLSPWDDHIRKAAVQWIKDVSRHPTRLFKRIYLQSIGIIQAPDIQTDGRADMCDSCPDMTVYNGTLINSCRMDEYRLFGGLLSVLDRKKEEAVEFQPENNPGIQQQNESNILRHPKND